MKMLKFLPLFLVCFFTVEAVAQKTTLRYSIGAAFFDLGEYTVTKETKGDSTIYDAISDVEVPYLFSKYKVQFITKSKFYKDTMVLCHVDVFVNGKLREFNHTVFVGDNYKLHRIDEDGNERNEMLNVPAIFVTSTMLFFNEPLDDIKYAYNYAELYGHFNKIEESAKNSHDIVDKLSGRKTTYNYKKGQIVSTEVDYPIMTFGLKRKKD